MKSLGLFIASFFLVPSLIASPTNESFNPAILSQIDAALLQAIAENRLPGAVLWLEQGSRQYHKPFGARALSPPEPMTENTLFDAASLTKVIATTPSILLLRERGKLDLNQPISSYLSEFAHAQNGRITVRQLLTHTSGFPRALRKTSDWSNLSRALRFAAQEKLNHPPGTHFQYSDINFIIAGELAARVAATPLNRFADSNIFLPLQMLDTSFLPPPHKHQRIAPSGRSSKLSDRARVHDPKARALGGVAGHAGVFTTASDLARFCRMLLNRGTLEGVRILTPDSVALMTSVQSPPSLKAKRGLGWDIDSEFSRPRGDIFPVGSFGHTGFTGVSVWVDPSSQTFWILLSNRLHSNSSQSIYALQKFLGTTAARAAKD